MHQNIKNVNFIKKSKDIHGDKYDYSLVEYKNNYTKIKIICPKHGVFEQIPKSHLTHNGCKRCNFDKYSKNVTHFINKSKNIHCDKYDYSLVEYKNNRTKVKIICHKHGVFEQMPYDHQKGLGCKRCNPKTKLSNEDFIKKSKEIHGDKYDYSLIEYKNNNTNIKIICPEHGLFEQKPLHHFNGHGCSICSKNKKYTTEDFIKKSKKIHGDKYDYSLINLKNLRTKIDIICSIHGIFKQRPRDHLYNKNGCPLCNISKGEIEISKLLENKNIKYIKQKTFKGCKNIHPLKFDFYIPIFNICIEFDGEQHFKPIDGWGGQKKLELIKKRDNIKNEYCKNNNIKLIRIKYDDDINKLNTLLF